MGGSHSTKLSQMPLAIPFMKPTNTHPSLFRVLETGSKYKITHSVAKFSNALTIPLDYPKELDVLKPLNQIFLNQTKITDRGLNIALLGGYSTVELDTMNKKGDLLLKIAYSRGNQPQDHKIDVYGIGEDRSHLADMDLERSIQYKGCILCVKSPPGNLIGQVYELPGISQVAIVKNGKGETILQILMNGEFGWSNSAQILSAKGDKKLGRMYKSRAGGSMLRNALHTVIHLPKGLNVPAKLTLIGTCLHLMGRYQT